MFQDSYIESYKLLQVESILVIVPCHCLTTPRGQLRLHHALPSVSFTRKNPGGREH